ncbi:hypothetical protein JTB14_033987 [Gonioctena quinquepunctata]|nr:hypothetical protein JTB14_033987 [Gonioctena quinquepunctata]
MDIRKFFGRGITTHKRKEGKDSSSGSNLNNNHDTIGVPQSSDGKGYTGQSLNSAAAPVDIAAPDDSSPAEQACAVNPKITKNDGWHENDIGSDVGVASQLTVETKKELLQNSWVPPRNYDFKTDASHLRRKFNHAWLDQYEPWLVFSKRQKGALCKHFVLFPPITSTVRGVLGSFMIRPVTKFKNVHEDAKKMLPPTST